MKFFSSHDVIAFMSDATMDFTPLDFDAPLTKDQQDYLKNGTGVNIPQVFWRRQIHGDVILIAEGNVEQGKGCPEADAYITNTKKLPIAIRTADCVPVFIFDPVHQAIGLAHAGWKGTYKQIASKTIKQMQDKFGSKSYDLKVVLGPGIRSCCYAVSEEFKQYFPHDISERDGKLYADIVAVNAKQVLEAGVSIENVFDRGQCTCCNPNYFSFRRDGEKSGRMISVMMLL